MSEQSDATSGEVPLTHAGVIAELLSRSHHVEEDDPDEVGDVSYRYEYDLLTLRVSTGLQVLVRSYSDEPEQAALLRFMLDGRTVGLGDVKSSHEQAVAAFVSFLRQEGFSSVRWLGGEGYVEVPTSRLQ